MNPKIIITSQVLTLIAELDEFKGRWLATTKLKPDRLAALKHVATIESIGSSTRIEGVKLTDEQIEKLLTGLKTFSFKSRDEQEVAGYAEAMEMIFSSYQEISLAENHIKQLHKNLLRFSAKDERHRGEYKKLPNHVEAFDLKGKSLGVIFETTAPFETPRKMAELIEWTNKQLNQKELHPLLIISVFVVCFLAIHPFQDGNGRLSRILTTLLLLRSGYIYVPYSSLERIIEDNKDNYYLALRRAQATLEKDDSNLTDWIVFFLKSMQQQKKILEKKLETEESLLAKLPDLSLQIIDIIRARGKTPVGDLVTITKANRNTVKAHLRKLVVNGYLIQDGTGKGTQYRLKS